MRFLPLALLLAASCNKEDAVPPDIGSSKQQIWETIKAFHEAGDKGSEGIEKMASFFAPEITIFKGSEDFVRGKEDAVRELTNRVKHYEGQSRATILGREVINITGDVAVVTYVASVGTQRAAITAVLRRTPEKKWLLSHLHESWPPEPKKP